MPDDRDGTPDADVDAGLVTGLVARLGGAPHLAVAEAPRERWQDDLGPAEARCVRGAHPERRASFAAGRHLARRALAQLGAPDAELGRVAKAGRAAARAPDWPDGFTGSLSHTARHCAVVVARRTAVAGIGVDLEAPSRMRPGLLDRICTPRERARLREAGDPPEAAALYFSAKEAFYKLWHPLAGQAPGFRDVEVEILESRRFRIELLPGASPPRPAMASMGLDRSVFAGVWDVRGDLIAALMLLPAAG